jgi:hypothetical protein
MKTRLFISPWISDNTDPHPQCFTVKCHSYMLQLTIVDCNCVYVYIIHAKCQTSSLITARTAGSLQMSTKRASTALTQQSQTATKTFCYSPSRNGAEFKYDTNASPSVGTVGINSCRSKKIRCAEPITQCTFKTDSQFKIFP